MVPTNEDIFRLNYSPLTEDNKAKIKTIKEKAAELLSLYNELPNSRYKSLAVTELENSVMWIAKELTASENNK